MNMHPGFIAAQLIMDEKSKDYGAQDLSRSVYFPFGSKSYLTMLHTKMQRLISLENKGPAVFESRIDTVKDMMNYLAFYYSYLEENNNE